MKQKKLFSIVVHASLLTALACAAPAYAQYIWLNEKGVKQYSDMPPPPSVPKNRIVKAPGISASPQESASVPESGDKPAAEEKAPASIAEKNAEFQKRKMEQAEKEKKDAEKRQRDADKARNCQRAREYKQTLDSGQRVTRTDKNGERQFLDDQARAREARENQRIIDEACK